MEGEIAEHELKRALISHLRSFLLLCEEQDRTVVEYSPRQTSQPIGVADDSLTWDLPDELQAQLPSWWLLKADADLAVRALPGATVEALPRPLDSGSESRRSLPRRLCRRDGQDRKGTLQTLFHAATHDGVHQSSTSIKGSGHITWVIDSPDNKWHAYDRQIEAA